MGIQLHGQLAGFHIPELLGFFNLNRKSGILEVISGSQVASIFFGQGEVVWARTNDPRLRLGAILLRARQIDRAQHDRLESAMLRDAKKFGAVAVEAGVLDEDELQDALKLQVAEIVFDCYAWNDGTFTFNDTLCLPVHAVTIAVEICNLIMEGARRIDEWEECLQLFPDAGVVLRRSSRPENQSDFTLSHEEWELLERVDGLTPLRELAAAGTDPLETHRLLYGLLANRLIEIAPAPAIAGEEEAAEDKPRRSDTDLIISRNATLSFRSMSEGSFALLVPDQEGDSHTLVEQEYRVGRRPDNELQVIELSVSAHHARIFRSAGGWMIEDLNSRNGTFVNDEPIGCTPLRHDDRVRFGDVAFTFNQVSYAAMARGSRS